MQVQLVSVCRSAHGGMQGARSEIVQRRGGAWRAFGRRWCSMAQRPEQEGEARGRSSEREVAHPRSEPEKKVEDVGGERGGRR